MTEPGNEMTEAEMDTAIRLAARKLLAAALRRPRDQAAIDTAQAEYDALLLLKNSGV